jgi:hypothetical protein
MPVQYFFRNNADKRSVPRIIMNRAFVGRFGTTARQGNRWRGFAGGGQFRNALRVP